MISALAVVLGSPVVISLTISNGSLPVQSRLPESRYRVRRDPRDDDVLVVAEAPDGAA